MRWRCGPTASMRAHLNTGSGTGAVRTPHHGEEFQVPVCPCALRGSMPDS